MDAVIQNLPPGGRVAVVRLRSLGDCVLTTPAVRILKQARPDLQLAVVVEPRFRAIFEDNPDIDALLAPQPGELRRWRPALALNLHGGSRSAILTAISGARYRAGFGHFRHQWIYNVRIPRAQEILSVERKVHTAEHLASAVFYLGVEPREIPRACLFAGRAARPSHMTVIHAFASHPSKAWPAERFLQVAEHLRRLEMEPVFVAGPGDDVTPFRGYRVVQGAPLGEVKALLAGAALFVGNDSGPAHMAAAFGVPAVVIFGSSDMAVWRPWKAPAEVMEARGGIGAVPVQDVLAALGRLRVHA